MSFTISGVASAKNKIQQVLRNVQEGSEEALDVGANAGHTQARANCPVRSGKLRNSLDVESEQGHRYVGTSVNYGLFVHEGTSRQSANPFLLNGAEETKGEYVSAAKSIKVL